jgi:PAS domain S-box-containing protein
VQHTHTANLSSPDAPEQATRLQGHATTGGRDVRVALRRVLSRIHYALPSGHTLPDDAWERRHHGILTLLWMHVIGVPLFGMAEGYGVVHSIAEGGVVIAVPALLATFLRSSRKVRAGLVSLGLLTSSALIVHFSGGYVEAHFHFFVMIVVLTLYEDWFPFLLAGAYVVIHHGLAGALDPKSVFNHPAAWAHPWRWAIIHAIFVSAAGVAAVLAWRLNEDMRRRLTSIVDSSDDAIFSTTLDGAIETWNRGAERIYGYSPDEIKGRHISILVPDGDPDKLPWTLQEARAGKSVENFEAVRVRKDGRRICVSLTTSVIWDTTGRAIGFSTIARDITERKRAAEELKEAQEEADRMKDEFFELISHDLRTPLASIKGYADLLASGDGGELPEQGRQFVEVIVRNTARLERLVDDLLFLAHVESGSFSVHRREVDLGRVASESVEAAKPRAEEKQIELKFESEPLTQVAGDEQRLGQLLDNLISNAIKYTPEGGRVETRLHRQNGSAEIEVKDSGIGIPPEEQHFLFKRFFRASTATDQSIPGVGLGLTIVKAIAEAHGGEIDVESAPGDGTTFRVKLPLARPVH